MSAYKRPLPFLPIMTTDDDETPHRVATSFGKRSFETQAHRQDSQTQQLQDETENFVLKPSIVLKPKQRTGTRSSCSIREQNSDSSLFSSSPHCFQLTRRTSRSAPPVLMPSSIQHFNRGEDLAEEFHHLPRPRFLPLLPQECEGNSIMTPPQEFLMFKRTRLPRDLQG